MSRKKIDVVIVSVDRVANNDRTANKISAYSIAVAARNIQCRFIL